LNIFWFFKFKINPKFTPLSHSSSIFEKLFSPSVTFWRKFTSN
jgi:hypothetical protein